MVELHPGHSPISINLSFELSQVVFIADHLTDELSKKRMAARSRREGCWFREDSMIGGGCGPVGVGHTNGAPQIPRFPGFPVESCGFDQVRVVLLGENHNP
jgi:hypothetical protein